MEKGAMGLTRRVETRYIDIRTEIALLYRHKGFTIWNVDNEKKIYFPNQDLLRQYVHVGGDKDSCF